jgi:hypothetical protein
MSDEPELEPVTIDQKNRSGVVVTEMCLQFDQWSWGIPYDLDAISVNAADVVMRQLVHGAALEIDVHDGHAQLWFWAFDCEFALRFPLLDAVDYWVSGRTDRDGSFGPAGSEDHAEALAMLAGLEEACRRIRKALDA